MLLRRPLVCAALLLPLLSCGSAPRQDGFVLIHEDQDTSAVSVELGGWRGTPVLPLALGAATQLTLHGPNGSLPLQAIPGTLTMIDAATGRAERLVVGLDIAPDRLLVKGSEKAVRELAESVDAQATRRPDGSWQVDGPELFERGSFLKVPPGIKEVAPEFLLPVTAAAPPATQVVSSVHLQGSGVPQTASLPRSDSAELASLVGLYRLDDEQLLLDAGGHFTLTRNCNSIATGAFRRSGNSVVLAGEAAQLTLRLAGEALVQTDSRVFTPLEGTP